MTYDVAQPTRQPTLGLPFTTILGLGALGVPRVVLHDLHLIDEGQLVTWLLAIAPPAIWIWYAISQRIQRPFRTLLVTGVVFGVMLVVTHQLLWVQAFDGDLPSLGPGGTLVPRIAAVWSGLMVGTVMGAVTGGIAAWLRRRAG